MNLPIIVQLECHCRQALIEDNGHIILTELAPNLHPLSCEQCPDADETSPCRHQDMAMDAALNLLGIEAGFTNDVWRYGC